MEFSKEELEVENPFDKAAPVEEGKPKRSKVFKDDEKPNKKLNTGTSFAKKQSYVKPPIKNNKKFSNKKIE